jgi:hypothetical protein
MTRIWCKQHDAQQVTLKWFGVLPSHGLKPLMAPDLQHETKSTHSILPGRQAGRTVGATCATKVDVEVFSKV